MVRGLGGFSTSLESVERHWQIPTAVATRCLTRARFSNVDLLYIPSSKLTKAYKLTGVLVIDKVRGAGNEVIITDLISSERVKMV